MFNTRKRTTFMLILILLIILTLFSLNWILRSQQTAVPRPLKYTIRENRNESAAPFTIKVLDQGTRTTIETDQLLRQAEEELTVGFAITSSAIIADRPISELSCNNGSGDWYYEQDRFIQADGRATDIVQYLDVFADRYILQSEIEFPTQEVVPDVGGGFIFHMPERYSKCQAQMVRFIDGGDGIMWGYFDANGVFVGEGDMRLDLAGDQPITLTITVESSQYSISVNDELLASDLPLAYAEGWVGLLTYRGIVSFGNVQFLPLP